MKTRSIVIPFLLCMLMAMPLFSQVSLPHIFSDNMVLQRDQPVKVWGKAGKGEKVTVSMQGQTVSTKTNGKGEWTVTLKPMHFGGPYELKVQGKNTLVYENVLVGDVWLCSGQSNMEWPVRDTNNAALEISGANYPEIRSFNVVKAMDLVPQYDFEGKWEETTPETAGDFSAVAYYFAREVYEATRIPIGIINSSWGGTDIETWTSMDSFLALGDHYMKRYKDLSIENFDSFVEENNAKGKQYQEAFRNDKGLIEKWYDPATDVSSWKKIAVPGLWHTPELRDVDGIVWMRYDVTIADDLEGKEALLSLGKIDDDDFTWVNGTLVGETSGYQTPRGYIIPVGVLKKGKNTIVVKVVDGSGDGGIYGEPEEIALRIGGTVYPLAGDWQYMESATNKQFDYVTLSPNMYPSLLYNAMIHPILNFRIKGVTWYQGENNASAAYDYQTMFPNMIQNWRTKFGYEFPFYWVQLANFMAKNDKPVESDWAELREAQTMTLSLPQTGQAVITDIGEADDIHPRNKQDVGKRLALIDLHFNHGKEVEYSGPVCKEMKQEGNKLVLWFEHSDGGLVVKSKYGYIEGFAVAGDDGIFHWAKAYEKDGKVYVYSESVDKPVSLRYGWSDNPDVNLFNKAGLPAGPFRMNLDE